MDDSGVADAFYTVLSIAIVMMAAIAVSGVVLSATMKQGREAGSEVADFGDGGMEKGLYGFYYAVDGAQSSPLSGDPDDIVLKKLALERVDGLISFNSNTAPASAPSKQGAVIWSGYLYVPADGDYLFEVRSEGKAWAWLDGKPVANGMAGAFLPSRTFSLQLTKGYHPLKVKFYYSDIRSASCSLLWQQDGRMVPVDSLYR